MRRNRSPPRRKNRSPPRPVRTHQCARASLALKPRASLFEPVAAINAWSRETGDETQESTRLFTRVCNQRRASARRGHLRNQRRADTHRGHLRNQRGADTHRRLLYTRAGPDRLTRTEPTHLLSNETPKASSHTPQATEPTIPAKPLFHGRQMPCVRRGRTPQAASAGKQPLDHFPQSVLSSAETACSYFPAFIISTSFAFTAGSAVVTIVAAVPSDLTALRL